ncbi:hypothetical protein BX600DRAFT_439339 [Xylariales sp. PMI_506]|nr:hypothetical protein BX600DRAFT_439339 [Xylariales sp. PMI_506]
MKFSCVNTLSLLLGIASALPAELDVRAGGTPSNNPITFENGPATAASFVCGTHTYSGQDIYIAAQRGVALQEIKDTRGRNKYPHAFDKNDSKGNTLTFPAECPADKNRQEFPLMNGSPYDGGKNNVKQGDERVVYYYEEGEIDDNGNAKAYYCGIMTHVGAPTGGFIMC